MSSTVYNKTPILRQYFKNIKSSPQFYLKYECLQPSGSFKSRGIGNLILKNINRINNDSLNIKKPHVFASSGGNAGLAAATASNLLNIPCTVVLPTATKLRMVEKIRNTGANVIIKGDFWKEADNYLKDNILSNLNKNLIEPIYVHPFDNPLIWEGHSTIIDEILTTFNEQKNFNINNVKGIICSIGGGGLYNGLIHGLEKFNLANKIPIIGVETNGCQVFNTSLKLNKQIEFKKINTIATSLGTSTISKKTFENAIKYNTKSVVLNDKDVIKTCLNYTKDFNLVTEPACGAAIHLAYNVDIIEKSLNKKLNENDIIIIIACGGSSNTIQELEQALIDYDSIENQQKKNLDFIENQKSFLSPMTV